MTEVERLRDMALTEILKYVSIGQRREYPDTSQDTMRLAFDLDAASAKQHDADRDDPDKPSGHCQGCSTGFSLAKAECRECVEAQARKNLAAKAEADKG